LELFIEQDLTVSKDVKSLSIEQLTGAFVG
jgi:hypothetical protein